MSGSVTRITLGRYAASVRLDATVPENDAPKWIQVGEQGLFMGHPSQPRGFELTAEVFQQIVRNFRSHPSYQKDAGRVVPFDFKHASEADPADIAVNGAPAQAWAHDLDVRVGLDGKAELWALTEYLEPAKSYVRGHKYQWCSMAIWPHSKHPVTGLDVGWTISSIALTNDPFIRGMVPIAAELNGSAVGREAGAVVKSEAPKGPLPNVISLLAPRLDWKEP